MSNFILEFWHNYLSSGILKTADNNQLLTKVRFVNSFSILGIGTLVIFGIVNLFTGNLPTGAVEFAFGLILIVNLIVLRAARNINLTSFVLMFSVAIPLIFLLFTGGIQNTGILWFFTYPVTGYLLLGKKGGTFWLLALIVAILAALMANFLFNIPLAYQPIQIRQLIISLFVVSGVIYFFQDIVESSQKQLAMRNQQLQQEIAEKIKAQYQNDQTTKETFQKNIELEGTKKAMINLLEDSRELEKQLQDEKTNVEKKVAERTKELQEEQAMLEASIRSINVGFVLTDNQGEVLTINPTAEHILCVSKQGQLPGAFHSGLILNNKCSMDDIEKNFKSSYDLKSKILESVEKKNPIEVKELEFNNLILHIFIAPIVVREDEGLKIIGAVILIEDTTEERILQRSKDEFFSIASHELRTPLTSIKGNSAMLKEYYVDKIKDNTFKEMIEDIHDGSVRLIEIVNDFLNVSRLEQGRMSFKKVQFNAVEIARQSIRELEGLALQKGLYLKLDPGSPSTLLTYADPERTKEAVSNLISNSIKYSDQGGIVVNFSKVDGMVKITVKDTGRGIAKEQQSLLFRKFQQAGENILTRDTTKGTGLGLYISKMMVEGMGGKIFLEASDVNIGSAFSLLLPQPQLVSNPTVGIKVAAVS